MLKVIFSNRTVKSETVPFGPFFPSRSLLLLQLSDHQRPYHSLLYHAISYKFMAVNLLHILKEHMKILYFFLFSAIVKLFNPPILRFRPLRRSWLGQFSFGIIFAEFLNCSIYPQTEVVAH